VRESFTIDVSDGVLSIVFSDLTNFPIINAIEIVPADDVSDAEEAPSSATGLYYAEGNTIYEPNGHPHRFYGVSYSGLELDCQDYRMTQQNFNRIKEWNANLVMMADQNSLVFWREFAAKYANHPNVIFELYNEPHDVSWDCWLNGCITSEGWQAVGVQQLYDTVRGTGANNIVIIGGLDWGYDLSGVPDYRVEGANIIYATHVYDFPHKQAEDWERAWGFLSDSDPVIVSEFGTFDCTADFYTTLIDYAETRNQTSWIAWAWTASDPVGASVQNALLALPSD
jgi:hypothetical protein